MLLKLFKFAYFHGTVAQHETTIKIVSSALLLETLT
jgi:hypothetical protein